MIAKMLIGTAAAAAVGVGSVSAATASSPTPGSGSLAAHAKGKHAMLRQLARHAAHGQIVLQKKKDGSFVTVDVVHGTVSAVSSKSITVRAADKKSETFTITPDTRVRSRVDKKGSKSTISAVKTGDQVFVVGTGASSYTARIVVDVH
jgi:lipoprotein-anchoring transpeptidase ErfK/SrfK